MTKWMVGLSARRVITREGGSLGEGMKILMGQKYASSPYSLLAMVLGVGYAIIKQNRETFCSHGAFSSVEETSSQ